MNKTEMFSVLNTETDEGNSEQYDGWMVGWLVVGAGKRGKGEGFW